MTLEPMPAERLENYRQQLLEQQRSLARRVEELDDAMDQEKDRDWSEMAASRELAEVNAALEDKERADLDAVQAALERIEAGTFGQCTSCSTRIEPVRLDALPWAARCISCQETQEASSQ